MRVGRVCTAENAAEADSGQARKPGSGTLVGHGPGLRRPDPPGPGRPRSRPQTPVYSVRGLAGQAQVPKITRIFESQAAALPLPTRILMGVSDFVVNHWFLLLLAVAAISVGLTTFLRSKRGCELRDQLEMKLPLLSRLRIKVMVARYCQTLGTLLKSGVDLKTSLEISRHVVVNRLFISKLDQLIIDVNNKGIPLSAAMARIDYFPEYVRHVVSIGEEAARVDELLEKGAVRMQAEVNTLLEALTSLLQPVLMLILGGAAGFIALAVLLPMPHMSQILQ